MAPMSMTYIVRTNNYIYIYIYIYIIYIYIYIYIIICSYYIGHRHRSHRSYDHGNHMYRL